MLRITRWFVRVELATSVVLWLLELFVL